MPNPETTLVVTVPPALKQAIESYATAHGVTMSDVVRQGVARKIGRPELAKVRARGRPAKE